MYFFLCFVYSRRKNRRKFLESPLYVIRYRNRVVLPSYRCNRMGVDGIAEEVENDPETLMVPYTYLTPVVLYLAPAVVPTGASKRYEINSKSRKIERPFRYRLCKKRNRKSECIRKLFLPCHITVFSAIRYADAMEQSFILTEDIAWNKNGW